MSNAKTNSEKDEAELNRVSGSVQRLVGRLIWAGNLTVNGEDMAGVAVEISPDNLRGKPMPMYQEVEIVPAALLDGWTVKYEDWKKLADAAQWLARACKDRLPPGHFAKIEEEYSDVRNIFSPNA
jgi:hypothetical protein